MDTWQPEVQTDTSHSEHAVWYIVYNFLFGLYVRFDLSTHLALGSYPRRL